MDESRGRGRDAYGLMPDYHACYCTPGGVCISSGKRQYDGDDGPECSMCEGLAAIPLPGATSRCGCGDVWSLDPASGLAYCARCEHAGFRSFDALHAKREARKAAEKAQDRVVHDARQTAMRFEPAS